MSLISIIMPTYKRADMIEKAIKSVINQTYEEWELIIVDDNLKNSEERKKTREILLKYENNKKIRYIEKDKNEGGALSRNTGIENAKGEYIAFLDDDDEYEPTKLELQIKKFKEAQYKNLAIVYCQMKVVNENGKILKITTENIRGNALKYHLMNGLGFTGTLMIKKEILEEVGMFSNTPSLQEYIMILKILKKGYEVDVVEEPLFKLYQHSGERITKGKGRIEGHKYAYELKKDLFHLLNKKERKIVEYSHFYNMVYAYMIAEDRINSLKNYFKLLKKDLFNFRNLELIILILIGYQRTMNIKENLKK